MILLHIAGAAALLVWAVRLVRTGVERAFAVPLRRLLRQTERSRFQAALTGAGAAIALQSATAVAILATNFAAAGTLTAATGLAILLGADIGSAVVTQLLVVKPGWLMPIILLSGVTLFLKGHRRGVRQTGRILIGLALIFVALGMIRDATEPLRDSENLAGALRYLGRDPITAFAIAAIFTWLVHSSVAAVLLVVTLVSQGILPIETAAAMILGANLGGSYIAVPLTMGAPPEARLIVLSNVALRGGGALIALFLTPLFIDYLGPTLARQSINLHLAFNIVIAIITLPLTGLVLRVLRPLVPKQQTITADQLRPSALDPAALKRPDTAIVCATREVLRTGETVESMLRAVMKLFTDWDENAAETIRDMGKQASRLHLDTKLYLAKLGQTPSDDDNETAQRAIDLSTISGHLDAAGNTIAYKLVGLAKRTNSSSMKFSPEGLKELQDFHDRVLSNAQAALNILISDDSDSARSQVEEKEMVRAHEERLQRAHIERLRRNTQASIDTSNTHQEILRELKNINTAFTMIAYPILSDNGDLLRSRLREREDD